MKRLLQITLAFLLLGCAKDGEITKTFEGSRFQKIEFGDSFEVVFHTSDEFKIAATGSQHFVEEMEVTFGGDSVIVKNNERAAWLRPESNKVRLDVYCDSLTQIRAGESCSMTCADTLRSEDLLVIVSSKLNIADLKLHCSVFGYYNVFPCSGVMTFSGKTDQLNVWNDALMEVRASQLRANRAFVENRSGAPCSVNVRDELAYSILNRGDILLSGNPPIIEALDTSGEGELIVLP